MRHVPRRRRRVDRRWRRLLIALGFAYDAKRDAFILRLVGEHVGPVFRLRAEDQRRSSRAMKLPTTR